MKKKILLVEDNPGDQCLIKEILSESDLSCEIIIASSGEEAVKQAASLKADVAIVDTQLPGMDGFETCKKIKQLCGDATKVIMMTGLVDAVDAVKAREMGADDYCVKTSDLSALSLALKTLIS